MGTHQERNVARGGRAVRALVAVLGVVVFAVILFPPRTHNHIAARRIIALSHARQIAFAQFADAQARSAADAASSVPSTHEKPSPGPIWLRGVDEQGRPTREYDSALILNALLTDHLSLEFLLPFGAEPPADFDTWADVSRVDWIREHGQFDLVLPSDPSAWRADLDDADLVPLVVQRVEYAYDEMSLIIVYLDGQSEWLPPAEVEALVVKHTGKTLAQLREPNALAANAADAMPAAPDAAAASDKSQPAAVPAE